MSDNTEEMEAAEDNVVQFDRKRLRAMTVGADSKSEPKPVECEINGQTVVFNVHSLSYKDRKAVHQAATTTGYDEDGEPSVDFDQTSYELELLIRCTRVPQSGELLFEPTDREELEEKHIGPGHWMTKLISAAQEMNRAGN